MATVAKKKLSERRETTISVRMDVKDLNKHMSVAGHDGPLDADYIYFHLDFDVVPLDHIFDLVRDYHPDVGEAELDRLVTHITTAWRRWSVENFFLSRIT
jgi:hypothetical protein